MSEILEKTSDNKYVLNTGYWVNFVKGYLANSKYNPEHTHEYIEMVYTFRGNGIHHINGREYPVKKGDLLFLNFNCVHSLESVNDLEYSNIMFKLDYVDENLQNSGNAFSLLDTGNFADFQNMIDEDNRKIHFSSGEREEIELLIKRTIKEQENPGAGSEFLIRSMLNHILVLVFRKMNFAMYDSFLINSEMLSFIKNNCEKPIKLKNIARNNYYSASYIGARFRDYTGMSFTEYITACRVEKAKKMLRETRDSVEDIMTECGFSNRTRCFNHFKNKVGVTPLKYRKQFQEEE